MTVRNDDLMGNEYADRVFYATGVFLEAEDFANEQSYHRGRLARVLRFLHGSGTVAGLEVSWDATTDEILVAPGLALDRLGRIIEVPKAACVQLANWFTKLPRPVPTFEVAATTVGPDTTYELVADVYARFVLCDRGRTPAFATGPFDAVDATVPSRIRDSYELRLERRGASSALPSNPYVARRDDEPIEAWQLRLHSQLLKTTWPHQVQAGETWLPSPLPLDAAEIADKTAVFLARVRLPVSDSIGTDRVRDGDGKLVAPQIDNLSREFVYSSAALYRWIEALQGTFRI